MDNQRPVDMKERQFLRISYNGQEGRYSQDVPLKEQSLLTTFLREVAIDEKVEVELITCTQDEWEEKFLA